MFTQSSKVRSILIFTQETYLLGFEVNGTFAIDAISAKMLASLLSFSMYNSFFNFSVWRMNN